jgi:DUF4097 and DUF4098 domain-containing protein YvlB
VFAGIALLALGVAARADSRIERNLKLDPGGKFILESSGGDVVVTGRPEPGARIVVTSNRPDLESLYEFHFDEEPGAVRVEAHKLSALGWPKRFQMRIEVQVPTRTSLELRTGGGDIRVLRLQGNSDLHTSGGDVKISELQGNLMAQTKGGDIDLHRLTGDATVETSGGDIRVESLSGRVEAHTSGGDVRVVLTRGNAQGGEIETSGGTITVAIDPTVNLNLEASASGGDLITSIPVTGHKSNSSLHATLGSGGKTLRLHTSGGDIHIRAL